MLVKVEGFNFQSWSKLEYVVERGVCLIDGFNADDQRSEGSGKSAIFNAMCWCAYGKIPKKEVNIDDVIREGEKTCSVSLTFEDGFSITRIRKSGANDLFYTLLGDGEEHRAANAVATQKEIIQHLGISYEGFTQTIYQSQALQSRFVQANQEDKMKVLTEIIELSIFDRAKKEAQERSKAETTKKGRLEHALEILEVERGTLDSNILVEEEKKKRAEDKHKFVAHKLDQQLILVEQRIAAATSEIERSVEFHRERGETLGGNLKAAQEQLAELLEVRGRLVVEVTALNKQIFTPDKTLSLINTLAETQLALKSIDKDIITRARMLKEISYYRDSYKVEKEKLIPLQEFLKNPIDVCPTCGTNLGKVDPAHAENEIKKIKVTLERYAKSAKEILEGLPKIEGKVELLNKEVELKVVVAKAEGVRTSLFAKELMVSANEKAITSSRKSIQEDEMKIDVHNEIKLPKIEEVLAPLNDERSILVSDITKHKQSPLDWTDEALKQYRKAKVLAHKKVVSLFAEVATLSGLIRDLDVLKTGFRDVKSYIFEGLLQELNFKINQYLEKLFDVSVSLFFEREGSVIKTDITINGVLRKSGLLSGGQNKRVSLAVDLALNDLIASRRGSKWGILILDEYFTGLGEESLLICLELLQEISQPILIIEHNTTLKAIVEQTFCVLLEDGVTRAVESLD